MKRFALESEFLNNNFDIVIGCDEVGRGSLAGPVVAAAVSFAKPTLVPKWWKYIADSKTIKPEIRAELMEYIKAESLGLGIGVVSEKVIDKINIHHASLRAMDIAVKSLLKNAGSANIQILVDGKFIIPKCKFPQQAIVRGDSLIHSIAAASIVAKVHRDALMERLDKLYPEYLFSRNKGYATLAHRQAIKKHGLSVVHRVSFCGNIV